MKTFVYVWLGLIGLAVLVGGGMLLRIALFPVSTASKLIDTAYDSQAKVLNADNAIYNYEWFKQRQQDIVAAKVQLDNARISYKSFSDVMPKDRTNWGFEDKNEDARLRAVVLGLENHLQELIATYNARASEATRNIFADHVLPNYIDALTFIRK